MRTVAPIQKSVHPANCPTMHSRMPAADFDQETSTMSGQDQKKTFVLAAFFNQQGTFWQSSNLWNL